MVTRAGRLCRRALLVVFGSVMVCTPARAQPVFVQGVYGPDVRRFSGDETDLVFDSGAGSFALTVGGFVTRHVVVALEIDPGSAPAETRTVSLTTAGRPSTITTSYSLRRRTFSALAGLHTPATRRVQFGAYAGLSFNAVRREIASDVPPIVLADPAPASIFTDRTAEPIVGADVAIQVAPHVAVVGGIRANGLSLSGDMRGFSIRPRGGMRISF